MSVALITGAAGLIGSEAAEHFVARGMSVVGRDNDMRRVFFGDEASTRWNRDRLERRLGKAYTHLDLDIRDRDGIDKAFSRFGREITVVIHAAAQPSHDWAARDPVVDFDINAVGRSMFSRPLVPTVRVRLSSSCRRTRSMETRRIGFLSSRWKRVGSSSPVTHTNLGYGRTCRSTRRSIVSSGPRKSQPTSSCRSTVAISGWRPRASADIETNGAG